MRIFYNNLIDASGVVITPSSENSLLPAANVADVQRKKVYRTGTAAAAQTIVFDLLSAKSVTAIILLDHTLTAADTLIKLEGHTADSWGAPSFSQSLTWEAGTISQVFSSQSYRYWRLSFTKSASGETRDIGRIFLGTYFEPNDEPDYGGFDQEIVDPSERQRSTGGQEYANVREQYEAVKLTFSIIPEADAVTYKTIFTTVGMFLPFFLQVQSTSPLNKIYYVKFAKNYGRQVHSVDASFFWNTKLDFNEQL